MRWAPGVTAVRRWGGMVRRWRGTVKGRRWKWRGGSRRGGERRG